MLIHFTPEEAELIKAYKDAVEADSAKDAVMNAICLALDYCDDPENNDTAYNTK